MLAGAVVAQVRSLKKIAANACVSALASSFYVAAFLGLISFRDPSTQLLFLAWIAIAASVVLTYSLFAVLGTLKQGVNRRRLVLGLSGVVLLAVVAQWLAMPRDFLALGIGIAAMLSLMALAAAVYSAVRGDRLAWAALTALIFMMLAMAGLDFIAFAPEHTAWEVHAATALSATIYLATMCLVLWFRYAYLIELRKVMAYGPSYDPVTKLRSSLETGHLLVSTFKSLRSEQATLGVAVLTISNMYALEQLYGSAAVNNALFVCAERLKRCVPSTVEIGRLGSDGFLLLMPKCADSYKLVNMARSVEVSLRRSVTLNTSATTKQLGTDSSQWVAEIGLGLLVVSTFGTSAADAVAMARRMSRTALSYPSRIAWFDHASGETVDLPDQRL